MGGIANLVGSIFGGGAAKGDANEAQYLNNQADKTYGNMNTAYQQQYAPIDATAAQGYGQQATTANAAFPGAFSALQQYTSNPGSTYTAGTGQQVLGSELGALNGGYGSAYTNFMNDEVKNGLSQQSIGADINTVKAADTQALNASRNATGAQTANQAGRSGDQFNDILQQIAGAGSTILGNNQQVQAQGAQGLAANEQYKQQAGEAALGTAGTMDTQMLSFLEKALQLPEGVLSNAAGFGQSGYAVGEAGAQGLTKAGALSNQQAQQNTVNPFSALGQIFSSGTGLGALTSLFGGGGGGGGVGAGTQALLNSGFNTATG